MKKRPLSIEEHRILGAELHDLAMRIQHVGCDISNRYGKTKAPGRALLAAVRDILHARSELEEIAVREYPKEFKTRWYFPGEAAAMGESRYLAVTC